MKTQNILSKPRVNQRPFLAVLLLTLFFLPDGGGVAPCIAAPPPADQLQTGDLVWPKKPGAVIPYNSRPGEATGSDAASWEREKAAYLAQLRKEPDLSAEEKARYTRLQQMTYREFLAEYMAARSPGDVTPFGSGSVSVGHVGIIQIVNGTRTVVEAMVRPGVRRISYAQWLRERPGELIWVGRLKGVSAENREAVARVAASHIRQPYNFWNFNLKDTSGFYCSKLAWLSIFAGAGFAPDGNPNPKRILWYSPKQLMHSKRVELIFNPGSYGSRRTGE
jgi:uncharacterized protein YycO